MESLDYWLKVVRSAKVIWWELFTTGVPLFQKKDELIPVSKKGLITMANAMKEIAQNYINYEIALSRLVKEHPSVVAPLTTHTIDQMAALRTKVILWELNHILTRFASIPDNEPVERTTKLFKEDHAMKSSTMAISDAHQKIYSKLILLELKINSELESRR